MIDLYCARRRDWSFAAAEEEGGEKDSESGEEVCGRYLDDEEGVRGPSSKQDSMSGVTVTRIRDHSECQSDHVVRHQHCDAII